MASKNRPVCTGNARTPTPPPSRGRRAFGVGAAQAGSDSSAPTPHSAPPVDGQAGGGSRKAGGSSSAAREGVSGVSPPPPPSAPPVDGQAGGRIFEAGRSSSAAAHALEQFGRLYVDLYPSLAEKLFCRKGTGSSERPHVNRQGALDYYAEQIRAIHLHGRVDPVNVLDLRGLYSDFRPVKVDGECFYRSFIFSYLEQILGRQDTNEEERLLAAIEEVAEEEHARLGWASEFSSSHEAFKELIKKVKSWNKKHSLLPLLTDRYLKQKLLKFFSTYNRTEDS
ncbi:hypothetical protein ZWY2020_024048 [Hordeum vulgare]|nr:hypothetical protein ZWY2020_024048 [Hordeum vulgare]